MPHPGTHIAALQMLTVGAASDAVADALGGSSAEPHVPGDAAMVRRNRYACFGAVGPDMLYFMLDGGPVTQAGQNLVCEFFATLRSLERVSAAIDKIVGRAAEAVEAVDFCDILGVLDAGLGELGQSIELAIGLLKRGLEGMVSGGLGLNLFSVLPAPRQANKPPNDWYWADHLHYHRTGQFTRELLDLAFRDPRFSNRAELRAYALGYLTHYVADVIGHPYVNQIVGGPYRLHRQRHTLVENFIDSFVWMHCHRPTAGTGGVVGDMNPLTGRKWLDTTILPGPTSFDEAAAFHRCRLNEFIDVGGGEGFGGAIEDALDALADALEAGGELIFGIENVPIEDDALFGLWSDMFLSALHKTYDGTQHPTRLAGDGFPRKEDFASAYATTLAMLRMATTESVKKPEFPDFSNFSDAARDFWNNHVEGLRDAIGHLDPHLGGSFSLDSLLDWAESVLGAAVEILTTVLEALRDFCRAGSALTQDIIHVAFYFLRAPLWAAYAALYRVLEMRAYAQPRPTTVWEHPSLWSHRKNESRHGLYPIMEVRAGAALAGTADAFMTTIAQDQLFSSLEPRDDPGSDPGRNLERASVPTIGQNFVAPADGEIETVAGPRELLFAHRPADQPGGAPENDMFGPAGPVPPADDPSAPQRNFGGIVPNCRHALEAILAHAQAEAASVVPPGLMLHDYNLDGDRGLGWLGWDLAAGSGPLRPAADVDTTLQVRAL